VQVNDDITGDTFDLEVALTWTGTGELERLRDRTHFYAPGLIVNDRFDGTFREAVASGSVSLGGTNLTPQAPEFAEIGSVKQGTGTIQK
jgi:hypothetical protein